MSTSVADLFVVLDSVTDPFSKGMEQAASDAEADSGRMTKALKAVAAVGIGLAVGVAAIGVKSIDMATQFQSSMETLHTQAGVAQSQIASLGNGVLNLAGQVGFSPDSLAEALYHIESSFASVGITGSQALNLLKIAAEGAAVGHADLVDVTNALDAAVVSGIPGVQNLSQAMGVLNATVGAGDMTMQDLANAFSTGLLANVKSYGLSITDVGAALAVFGDNNIRGQNAATDLRMAVQAMAVPAATAADELQKMGLSTTSLADVMSKQGLLPALELLKQKMTDIGVTEQNQGEVLTNLFGKKAGAGIVVLYDQLSRLQGKYPVLEQSASDFAGAWTATKATIQQQFNEIRSGADALSVRLGEALLPQVSKLISEGQNALGQMESGFTGADLKAPSMDFNSAALNQMATQITQPQTAFQRFGQTVHTALGDLEEFGKRLEPIGENFLTFGIDVFQAGEKIVTAVTPTIELIGKGLFGALELAGDAAANILGPAIKDFADFLASHQGAIKVFSEVILGGLIVKMTILGALNAAQGIVGLATSIIAFPLGQTSQIGDALTALKTAFTGSEAKDGEEAVQGLAGAFSNLKQAGSNILDKILPDSGKLAALSQMGTDVKGIETAAESGGEQLSLFETNMQGIVQAADHEQLALFDTNLATLGTDAEGAAGGMEEAATSAGGLVSTIGKFALGAGIVGAVVGGIAMISSALGHLAGVGVTTQLDMQSVNDELQQGAAGSATSRQAFAATAAAVVTMNDMFHNYGQQLQQVDQSMAQLVGSGHLSDAKAQFDAIAQILAKQGLTAKQVAADFPEYEDAVKNAGTAAQTMDGQVQALTGTLSAQQSVTQFNSDLLNLTQSIQTNGKAISGSSAAAIANQQAFQQAAQDVLGYYQQQRNANVPIAQATADMQKQVGQLEQTGIAAGLTKSQVDSYLTQLGLIKPGYSTTITANTSPALQNLSQLLQRINTSSGTVSVYENSSGVVGSTGSTVKARASGGPVERNNTYWVGENGPELVTFGANGYVTPTNMLQPAVLAGARSGSGSPGGGQGGPVTFIYVTVQGSIISETQLLNKFRTQVLQYNNRNSSNGLSLP